MVCDQTVHASICLPSHTAAKKPWLSTLRRLSHSNPRPPTVAGAEKRRVLHPSLLLLFAALLWLLNHTTATTSITAAAAAAATATTTALPAQHETSTRNRNSVGAETSLRSEVEVYPAQHPPVALHSWSPGLAAWRLAAVVGAVFWGVVWCDCVQRMWFSGKMYS